MYNETMSIMYETAVDLRELGLEVPEWIRGDDIDTAAVAAIVEGGCASGAWMPAVTYHMARETICKYSDAIDKYLAGSGIDLAEHLTLKPNQAIDCLLCDIVSLAVEQWTAEVFDIVETFLDDEGGNLGNLNGFREWFENR